MTRQRRGARCEPRRRLVVKTKPREPRGFSTRNAGHVTDSSAACASPLRYPRPSAKTRLANWNAFGGNETLLLIRVTDDRDFARANLINSRLIVVRRVHVLVDFSRKRYARARERAARAPPQRPSRIR